MANKARGRPLQAFLFSEGIRRYSHGKAAPGRNPAPLRSLLTFGNYPIAGEAVWGEV